jgi:hypothetical protein
MPAFTTALCLGLVPVLALAPGSVATSAEQSCSSWATQQTGFDPAHPPPAPVAANPRVAGSGTRARGAAGGAAIGAIAGDAGKGAAIGAVAGGVTQRSRNRRAARAQTDSNNQQYQSGRAAYDQALQSCVNSRSR